MKVLPDNSGAYLEESGQRSHTPNETIFLSQLSYKSYLFKCEREGTLAHRDFSRTSPLHQSAAVSFPTLFFFWVAVKNEYHLNRTLRKDDKECTRLLFSDLRVREWNWFGWMVTDNSLLISSHDLVILTSRQGTSQTCWRTSTRKGLIKRNKK